MRSFVSTGSFLLAVVVLALLMRPSAPVNAPKELLAAPSPLVASVQSAHDSGFATHQVIKVIDGDTVVIDIDGVDTTLRLIGMDTPETVDPRKPVQCFGAAASAEAKRLLSGSQVRIEMDSSQGTLDKYGRTLAYLYLPDGTLYNMHMIEAGFAHEYTYQTPYRYQAEFEAAEASSRAAKRGLWADDACASESDRSARPTVTAPTATGPHECSRNAYNCSDFATRAAAQAAYDACAPNDIHKLDQDGDGEACESLP